MVLVRELYECMMKSFKDNNWEPFLFEDFLQEAREELGCDDKGAYWGIK